MVMITMIVVNGINSYLKEKVDYEYTLDRVFEDDIVPVIKTETESIVRPYIDSNVKVGKYFYDYESDGNKQQNSLIMYENIYMQNTGVDYINSVDFDIVSILDGEVISIEDSEIYGKIVSIKHNDNLISVYSNITDINLSVGYKVSQGEIIASSMKSKVSEDNSMLHFEISYKGNYIDPENLYTIKVSEIQ
jgi:murein DD-endopeptidase MepM/ murein hydrolase activator NlpD